MQVAVNKDIQNFRQYLAAHNKTGWLDDEYWVAGISTESNTGDLLACGVLYFNPGHRINNLPATCLGNFYASDGDSAAILLKQAFEVAVNIAPVIIGPMNGSTWASYRFMAGGNTGPFYLEPYNPDEYNQYFTDAGFAKLAGYCSSAVNCGDGFGISAHIGNNGYTFRNFNVADFDNDIKIIYSLSNTAFAGNFLFTEINYSKFYSLYVPLKSIMDEELFIIAYKNGVPAGFVFGYPDFLQPGKSRVVLKTLGRLPGKEYSGLGTMLLGMFTRRVAEKGFTSVIHALMPADKVSIKMSELFGGKVFRQYALYSKLLK